VNGASIAWPGVINCTIELSVAFGSRLRLSLIFTPFLPLSLSLSLSCFLSPLSRPSPYRGNLRIPRRLGGEVIPLISGPAKLFGGQIRIYLLRSLARSPLSRAGVTERRPTLLFEPSGPRRYLIPYSLAGPGAGREIRSENGCLVMYTSHYRDRSTLPDSFVHVTTSRAFIILA